MFTVSNFKYILIFLFLGLWGKNHVYSKNVAPSTSKHKELKSDRTVKASKIISYNVRKKKISALKITQKVRGVKVLIPTISTHISQKFYHYSRYSPLKANTNFSLDLHYSRGQRGPPTV